MNSDDSIFSLLEKKLQGSDYALDIYSDRLGHITLFFSHLLSHTILFMWFVWLKIVVESVFDSFFPYLNHIHCYCCGPYYSTKKKLHTIVNNKYTTQSHIVPPFPSKMMIFIVVEAPILVFQSLVIC